MLFVSVAMAESVIVQEQFNTYPKTFVQPEVSAQEISAQKSTTEPKEGTTGSMAKEVNNFTIPLFFDKTQVLQSQSLEFEYDISSKDQIRIGPFVAPKKIFKVQMGSPIRLDPQLPPRGENLQNVALLLDWPQFLFQSGKIELIGESGQIIWSELITEQMIADWKLTKNQWQQQYSLVSTSPILQSNLAFLNFKRKLNDYKTEKEEIRFCLTKTHAGASAKICSERFFFRNTNDNLQISAREISREDKVFFNQEEVSLKGSQTVATDQLSRIYIELEGGESIDYTTMGIPFSIEEVTQIGEFYKIVGTGQKPMGFVEDLDVLNQDLSFYEKQNYLEKTIGRLKPKYWVVFVKPAKTKLYFLAESGSVHVSNLKIQNPPQESDRIYLHKNSPDGSYKDSVQLLGKKEKNLLLDEGQKDLIFSKEDPESFQWGFAMREQGDFSRNEVGFSAQGKPFKAYHEIYKGFPGEVSGRLTGILTQESEFVPLIEANLGYWFENILNSQNYYLSHQRWGVSTKYFQSVADFKTGTKYKGGIQALTADLKYRNSPGLWNWDESVGEILSYQDLTFRGTRMSMLGVGFFWARSMPKIFNDIFNIVENFRYPKWVDMEFIYYLSSLDSEVQSQGNYALNFHGKIMLSKKMYGEAGFGIKGFGFKNRADELAATTFYGTVGMGLNF